MFVLPLTPLKQYSYMGTLWRRMMRVFWHIMLVVVTEGRSIRSRYAVFCSNIINILINTMLLIKTVVTNVHSQCLVIVHCSLITKLCISSSC